MLDNRSSNKSGISLFPMLAALLSTCTIFSGIVLASQKPSSQEAQRLLRQETFALAKAVSEKKNKAVFPNSFYYFLPKSD